MLSNLNIFQIVRRYDVIFMQGIRDASQDVLHELGNRLNIRYILVLIYENNHSNFMV